jgi:conjugal transfer pilus assembly protein TraF
MLRLPLPRLCLVLALLVTGLLPLPAPAAGGARSDLGTGPSPERGWFFFESEKKPAAPPPAATPAKPPAASASVSREERCRRAQSWTPECGFVDPGEDFEFQARQRDALLEQMTMSNNNPQAVEAFQYYMKWVVERAAQVANLWQYNLTQNPELDATARQPVSAFGLRLMSDVREGRDAEIFATLRDDGAFFVYFTRNDCMFCHQMAPHVQRLARTAGLPVRNAALDEVCMRGFEEGCLKGKAVQAPAAALQVSIVPTVFIYIPSGNTWLRIATGLTDPQTMSARAVSFFAAYRNALLKGVANAAPGRAPVDFTDTLPTGTAAGVAGVAATPRAPTEREVAELLGKKP